MTILSLSVMFVMSPRAICEVEPFVVNDFEIGLGTWYGGGGGGAPETVIEQVKDAHDSRGAMHVTRPKGNVGWSYTQFAGRSVEFARLGEEGYEAVNFWVKGIEGIDKEPVRLHLTGAGDHSTDNRWQINFTAPLDEWSLKSLAFEDMVPWNQEKRPFALENIDYFGFFNAGAAWPDTEFIVDQIEFGPITTMKPESVQPAEKLSVTWGQIKGY